jgi:Protein kinase domain
MLRVGSRNTGQEWLLNKRYQVVKVLSSVGWGKTYVAIDTHHPDRLPYVIKSFKPISDDPDCLAAVRRLFEQEAQILKTLADCDRVPQLVDYLEVDRTFYLVQESIQGQPLSAELIPGQHWAEARVMALLQEVLEILAMIHDRGILHSDLRPEKLICTSPDGRLVLTGFNVLNQARSQLAALQQHIGATVALDTLGYMSVEQMRGKPLPSSDLYSLGIIAIQALTGLDPVQWEEDRRTGEILWQHHAEVSEELAAIISQMVRYHAHERYSSAHEVLSDLYHLIAQFPNILLASDAEPFGNGDAPVASTNGRAYPPIAAAPATEEEGEEEEEKFYFTGLTAAGIVTFIALTVGAGGYFLLRSPSVLRWTEGWFDRGDDLLAQAEQKYQAGELLQAEQLAKSIAADSTAYPEAKTAIAQWRKDWKTAQTQFAAVQQAAKQEKWSDVLKQASRMPEIAFWQQKISAMVKQAQTNVDREAQQILEQAYRQAIAKQFSRAIDTLKQIPEGTQARAIVPDKIAEYRTKEAIRASYFLQKAYNSAEERNFAEAIAQLEQIPQSTPAYTKAEQKKVEYQQKQEIKANYLLQRAYNRAIVRDFPGALTYLRQIPQGTIAYAKAREKILEYTTQQNSRTNSQNSSVSPAQPTRKLASDEPFSQEPFIRPQVNSQSRSEKVAPLSNLPFPFKLNPGGDLHEINTP